MVSTLPFRLAAGCALGVSAVSLAQQPIGTVSADAVEIKGLVNVSAGVTTIQNNGAVTAGKRTAQISLHRGGAIAVCSLSTVHLSQSNATIETAPLLVALERGAAEMRWNAERTDAIMTPDLRLELSEAAPLDLRIRVIANGDTCIENAGKRAPLIHVTEQFGVGGYLLKPGQHVLFEHGSVREVVDKETAGCGCPPALPLILADKSTSGKGTEPNAFPEAVSAGLAQPDVPAASPAGATHTQVAATLDYNGRADSPTETPAPLGSSPGTSAPSVAAAVQPTTSPLKQESRKSYGPIRRFLRKVFGGGS